MLRKITVVAAMGIMLTAVTSMAYSAGTASREASGGSIETEPLSYDSGRTFKGAIKKCPAGNITLQCLNKGINKLRKAFNNLFTAHVALSTFVTSCLQKTSVTRYGDPNGNFGYMWDDDGDGTPEFDTTALDFTVPGDPASAQMVVSPC